MNLLNMKTIIILINILIFTYTSVAQVVANAGPDIHSCPDDPYADFIPIGGSPTAQFGTPPYTYEWSMEDIVAGGGCSYIFIQTDDVLDDITASNPTITDRYAANRISFFLKVTDAMGVESYDTCVVTFSNFVYNMTFFTYQINPGDSVLLNQPINITGGFPPLTYHWKPEDGLSATHFETAFWAKPNQTTFYYVTITDDMGCQATGTPYYNVVVNTTGINEAYEKESLQIYPNPTSDFLNISNIDLPIIKTTIYDLKGKKILDVDPQSRILDLQNLNSGIYIIHIQTVKNSIVKKFQKL